MIAYSGLPNSLNLETLLLLTRPHIPHPNRLVITTTDKTVALEKQCSAEPSVSLEEPNRLHLSSRPVALTVVQRAI